MIKSNTTRLGLFSAAIMSASISFALPITGSLDFSGSAKLDADSLANVTTVLSWSNVRVTTSGVTIGSVLDATINPNDPVDMNFPWQFDTGLVDLWSVGGFSFDLNISQIAFQSAGFLAVSGTGIIRGNGYDATPGSWYFTSQGAGVNADQFSFSASTIPVLSTSVPDASSSALLFGPALVGLILVAKRRRRSV